MQAGERLDVYDPQSGSLVRSLDLPGFRSTRMQIEPGALMAGDSVMHDVARLLICQIAAFLALLLAASAVHKGMRWADTKRVVQEFAGVPRWAAPAAAAAAALAESLAALLLFAPAYRRTGALLAALIWSAYLALMLRAIVRGRRDVDCGCSFGPAQASPGRVRCGAQRGAGSFCIARRGLGGERRSGRVRLAGCWRRALCWRCTLRSIK